MPLVWNHEAEKMLVVKVSGELAQSDIKGFQQEVGPVLEGAEDVALLVILEDFAGWQTEKGWEDTSFADSYDEHLSRFAIVGDEQWRDQVLMFALAGLRPVEIEYFNDESAARGWLAS